MAVSRARRSHTPSEETQKRKAASQEKILGIFSAAIPRLGTVLDEGKLSEEKRKECLYSLNKLRELDAEIRRSNGWPTIPLSEFLRRGSPWYRDQVEALRSLKAKTLGRFLRLPLREVFAVFTEHGVHLPPIFQALHPEFGQEK